jgi:hypothetical protein
MRRWFDQLSFLWEDDIAPPEEVPRVERDEPAGVPRPLRIAARWALIGVLATSLLGQVIGIRLVAPVDAATSYTSQCNQFCDGHASDCLNSCAPQDTTCQQNCMATHTQCHQSCGG